MIDVNLNDMTLFQTSDDTSVPDIKRKITEVVTITENEFYLMQNGRRLCSSSPIVQYAPVHIFIRLFGGKGGFGSMLRAIGAQIEKTTNREACRDLSGRRLRDINEEKRLKTWLEQQVDQDKQAEEKRMKKLEKLTQLPKHEFKDEAYEKERSELTEKVEDAVLQGLAAAGSSGSKRKSEEMKKKDQNKKKRKLWVDADEEFSSSFSDDSEDEACPIERKEDEPSKRSDKIEDVEKTSTEIPA